MDSDRCKDSGEMYSLDDQGEYTLLDGAPWFSMQGLSDVLADVGEGIDETPAEEYAMMLEVTMADCPGWPHPPVFSWNVGMVMHILKSDTILRELEHVQVDGLGTAYLFFYNKQGHRGLGQDTAYVIWAAMEEAFSGWDFMLCPLYHQPPTSDGGMAVSCHCLWLLKAEKPGWEPCP